MDVKMMSRAPLSLLLKEPARWVSQLILVDAVCMVLAVYLGFSVGETENAMWRWGALILILALVVAMVLWHFIALQNTEELVQELGNRVVAAEQKAPCGFGHGSRG